GLAGATSRAGAPQVAGVVSLHCEVVEGELAGIGTGLPGLSVTAQRAPIIASSPDGLELVVGVEPTDPALGERLPAVTYNGKTYLVWQEVQDFSGTGPGDFVYVSDRLAGTITFAPAAMLTGATDPPPPRALAGPRP